MKSAETGHPLSHLGREQAQEQEQETNPDTRAVRTASQDRTANGHFGYGKAQLRAAKALDVAGFEASARSSDRAYGEGGVRPPETSSVPLGRLGRAAVLIFFLTIVFLAGIFVGASLMVNLPTRSSPTDIAMSTASPEKLEPPTPAPVTTDRRPSPEATPRPGPAAVIPPQSPPQPISTDARSPGPAEPTMPKDGPPPAIATTGAGAPEPKPQSPSTAVTPPPVPPPDAATPIVAAAPGATAAAAPVIATPPPTVAMPAASTRPPEPSADTGETVAFVARGDELFAVGDVASARLFYQRASEAGNAKAALRMGETYDPASWREPT